MLLDMQLEARSRMVFPASQTDTELQHRVTLYLNDRTESATRDLKVEARGGTVVLHGSVSSLYEKELCRHVCTRVAGVLRVVDETVIRAGEVKPQPANRLPR